MSLDNIMDMTDCTLCPRSCRVNRAAGEVGYCKEDAQLYAARAALYFDEEPVISGHRGSGAVFFSGCNMGCVYCQNYAIAKAMYGTRIEPSRLSEIFLELQEQDAENINLVTASHYLYLIIPALEKAKRQGLHIPVVYNTGAYERVEAIKADLWIYGCPILSISRQESPLLTPTRRIISSTPPRHWLRWSASVPALCLRTALLPSMQRTTQTIRSWCAA